MTQLVRHNRDIANNHLFTTMATKQTAINTLKQLQSTIDTTVEYVTGWTVAELSKELTDIAGYIDVCNNGIDGHPADGTADDMDLAEWLGFEHMDLTVKNLRKQIRFTAADIAQIEA